jgi:hypothetical protein
MKRKSNKLKELFKSNKEKSVTRAENVVEIKRKNVIVQDKSNSKEKDKNKDKDKDKNNNNVNAKKRNKEWLVDKRENVKIEKDNVREKETNATSKEKTEINLKVVRKKRKKRRIKKIKKTTFHINKFPSKNSCDSLNNR